MALNIFFKYNMKKRKKLNPRNSRILHDTMVALGALKEQTKLNNLPLHEMQVHLLDEEGDGIVLCLEYDELTGEINKTFYNVDEYYAVEEGIVEVELEDTEPLDPYARVPSVKSAFDQVVSEEYDEIFHNSDNDDDEPPLLN